jgi:hypothetical protein
MTVSRREIILRAPSSILARVGRAEHGSDD